MSKSLNNFTTIKDALKKYDPAVIRLWVISSHYRSIIGYSGKALEQAKENLRKISDWVSNLKDLAAAKSDSSSEIDFTHIYKKRFEEAMDDDLNTPIALAVIYELITETNRLLAENKLSVATAKNILGYWEKINKVFGLIIEAKGEIPAGIQKIGEERKMARDSKDFPKSDELRDRLAELGYAIEDLKDNNYSIKKK
jgi:cysteinyl-tRNA synthetase